MDTLIIASMRENIGKTSLIVGLAKVLGKKFGYMKPLGDRLLYRKKRLWDYDSALVTDIFGLADNPGDMSIGFDHSKLKYMYDEAGMRAKILEDVSDIGAGKEALLIECSKDLTCGASVYLDPLSIARATGGKLIIVVGGDDEAILDDLTFLKNNVALAQINFGGVIINKLQDVENFKNVYLADIERMGIKVLGMLPAAPELDQFTVGYLADRLFAKVVAGEAGLNSVAQNIFVGAIAVNQALRNPTIKKENILTITSGDRTDVILAALESDSAGVVLTNNILPPSNIIAQASERNIPLLLAAGDTYEIARQIANLQPLLTKDDSRKIELLEQLVKEHVRIEEVL
jgi:hypothetical protein